MNVLRVDGVALGSGPDLVGLSVDSSSRIPHPASMAEKHWGQCWRPGGCWVRTLGVRPNSPMTTTRVSSISPRDFRSVKRPKRP